MKIKSILSNIDKNLAKILLPWAIRHPRYLIASKNLRRSYKKSVELRNYAERNNLKIPPFLILSIAKQCNLKCAGCYATAIGTVNNDIKNQLKIDDWKRIIKEAKDLGVFGFVIAGGEPFLFPGLLDLCKYFKDSIFIIITNGTAIKENHFKELKKLSNTAVVVSIEGGVEITDNRRGKGVYGKALDTIKQLNKMGVISGISVTINRFNVEYWLNPQIIDSLIKKGVRIGFFIEYIPMKPNSFLSITKEQGEKFRKKIFEYRTNKKIYIIHSPEDEELLGGCVSAGRGFAHITPTGDLTPCPISNIASHNLKNSSLREGLASPLFEVIRENEHLLETKGVPCALYANQNKVESLAKSVGAYIINTG